MMTEILDELCQEIRYYLEHFEPSPHCSQHIQRQLTEWGEDCFLQKRKWSERCLLTRGDHIKKI